jgi:catechol 2,3-dioxygenase-like lactoylglutathione lyase family enzyme
MFAATTLDHIVLNVGDIDRSLNFYGTILGLAPERVEAYRDGTIGFPSVRVNAHTVIDLVPPERHSGIRREGLAENLNHLCLVWEGESVQAVIAYLKGCGIDILRPPSHAWGAHGRGTSIRVFDPDSNLVELRTYDPFEPEATSSES